MKPETLLKAEKTGVALEGLGDGKVRVNAASWEDPRVKNSQYSVR